MGWALGGSCVFLFFFPSCRPPPPHLVLGHGLGNRTTKLRHGTVGFRVRFFFVLPTPPSAPSRGVGQGNLATHAVAQDCVLFCFIFFVMHVILFSLCFAFSARRFPLSRDCGLCHLSISCWFSPFRLTTATMAACGRLLTLVFPLS